MRKPAIALALCLAIGLAPAAALEAKEGLVKIVVSETSARVSLYRLTDVAKGRYEALVFDQDPRTSFATLAVDGKYYRLGDSSEYRFTVSRTDTGVSVEFRSASCAVREDIDFAKSEGAALADGVRLTFTLENVSQKDSELGLRLLVDTWLAEKSGLHFRTDRRARVAAESEIGQADQDAWISTPGEKTDLMIQLSGGAGEKADRVLLANWKRLNDEPWGFEANGARGFTLLPYSVNDSAAALYWEPASVKRGASRAASVVLGNFNEKGYPAVSAPADAATEAIFAQTVLSAPGADRGASIAADLVAARDLISRIDRALSSGVPPSAEEIAAWNRILDRLEERKKGY